MGSQTTTSTQTADPLTLAREAADRKRAEGLPDTLASYGGEMVAGLTPQQLAGMEQARNASTQAQGGISQAQGLLQQGYTPQQITAMGYDATTAGPGSVVSAPGVGGGYTPQQVAAQQVTANTFPGANLSAYMNPYTGQVIDANAADVERQRRIAGVADSAKAAAAGAFGGSRAGVADSLTNEAYDRTNVANSAALREKNFLQAQAAIAGDQNREFQASDANARYGLQAGIANQGAGLTAAEIAQRGAIAGGDLSLKAQLANQQNAQFNAEAANRAREFTAGASNTAADANARYGLMGAELDQKRAGLLGDLAVAGQTSALQGANANINAGTIAQQTNDAADKAKYDEFLRQQKFPYEYAQFLQGFRGTPGSITKTVAPSQLPGQIIGGVVGLADAVIPG